jgi:serine/threonine protein kinase
MAPEQIEGAEADARTDIFAFGAVLYEMLTGRKAFEGKSQASVMAAILEREPPTLTGLVPSVPPLLDHLVKRCLAKDPDARWQSALDVKAQLEWIAADRSRAEVVTPTPTGVALGHRRCGDAAPGRSRGHHIPWCPCTGGTAASPIPRHSAWDSRWGDQ